MTSKVELCNLSLSHIKAQQINSLDETSKEAQTCKQHYPHALRATLSRRRWGFAKSTIALALTAHKPIEWAYAFSYPDDCVATHYIVPFPLTSTDRTALLRPPSMQPIQTEGVPFEIGSEQSGDKNEQVIRANYNPAYLAYTRYVDDPNHYNQPFIEAFTAWLAFLIAVPIVGESKGLKLQKTARELHSEALTNAGNFDASQGHEAPAQEGASTLIR